MIAAGLALLLSLTAASAPGDAPAPLFGRTPVLSLKDDRGGGSAEADAVRAFFLRYGLLVDLGDDGRPVRFSSTSPDDALRQTRRFLGLAAAADPRAPLTPDELALLKKRFPLPEPPVNPNTPAFDRPAKDDDEATPKDFEMLERGIEGALKSSPRVFPDGIGGVDVILQDTRDLYIYSRRRDYPYAKIKRWGEYQVYRLPHRGRPPEHEMWGCAGGPVGLLPLEDRRVVAEFNFRCAPWGSFRREQARRKSYYRFEEGYLASVIHEYGHQYEAMKEAAPTRAMLEVARRAKTASLAAGVDRERMAGEAFAEWCELKASRLLYPAHARRMLASLKTETDERDPDGHVAGLRLAAEMIDSPP